MFSERKVALREHTGQQEQRWTDRQCERPAAAGDTVTWGLSLFHLNQLNCSRAYLHVCSQ